MWSVKSKQSWTKHLYRNGARAITRRAELVNGAMGDDNYFLENISDCEDAHANAQKL